MSPSSALMVTTFPGQRRPKEATDSMQTRVPRGRPGRAKDDPKRSHRFVQLIQDGPQGFQNRSQGFPKGAKRLSKGAKRLPQGTVVHDRVDHGTWAVLGLPIDSLWIPYGFLIDSLWIPSGFPMDSLWIPHGFPMDSLWIPYGFTMDSLWIPYGFPVDSSWIPYGFPMDSLADHNSSTALSFHSL